MYKYINNKNKIRKVSFSYNKNLWQLNQFERVKENTLLLLLLLNYFQKVTFWNNVKIDISSSEFATNKQRNR